MLKSYDIVVLGAGIAGLALASQLSKDLDVLVIDKDTDNQVRKYWLTNQKSLINNEELEPYIDSVYNYFDIFAFDRTSHRCSGKFFLWDSHKLISHFKNIILSNGGEIIYDTLFYSYKHKKQKITIFANDLRISTSLVIDCMGYNSPIIYAKSIVDILGYYILYGASIKLKKPIDPIAFANIKLEDHVKYLEIFPFQNNSMAHVLVLSPEKSIKNNDYLKDDFDFIVNKSPFKDHFDQTEKINVLGGIIPIGYLKKKALDNIYFFGESGQLNPAATATGFTRILYYYKDLANKLHDHVKKNLLDQNSLESIDVDFLSPFHRSFQLYVFKDMLNWKSDNFLKLVQQMKHLDDDLLEKILFGDMQTSDIINKSCIQYFIKTRNWILLKNAIKAILF